MSALPFEHFYIDIYIKYKSNDTKQKMESTGMNTMAKALESKRLIIMRIQKEMENWSTLLQLV